MDEVHDTGPSRLRVVGISGSLRRDSYTRLAVAEVLRGAEAAGAETQLIDLRKYQLVFAGGDEGAEPPDVIRLRQEVAAAHGIILGTPEYHGSFSGVLKNALDLMGFDEFEGKMIGLVGVSAGRIGAFDALNSLRNVGRALHAWVVPQQVSIPEAPVSFGADGRLTDPELRQRLHEVGSKVAEFARLHEAGRAQEFVSKWQSSTENPGG
jgi:NAD(P)H-dependent FMN reductase